jgi:hypothetical protein
MNDSTFVDFKIVALAYLEDPFTKWAIIAECGNFSCTGPKNIIINFNGLTGLNDFDNSTSLTTPFTVTSNNLCANNMTNCTI